MKPRMRYEPGRKAKTRAAILDAAGRVFRRNGYHASGVDAVMKEAGFTAGGFYAHFENKDALFSEALAHSGAEAFARHAAALDGLTGADWVEGFLGRYLGEAHCAGPEDGCPIVALISEVSRADEAARAAFEAMVRGLVVALETHARPANGDRVLAALAVCVGGLGLARAVRDEAYAARILDACRAQARVILLGADGIDAEVS